MIGKRLSHYIIEEQIGRGGMGVVYRAHDEQLDRDVAIKVLPSRTLADEAARKRFRQEALSLARLNHPNIATVHEFGTEGDIDFLVTEYIAGMTLDSKLARGALPPEQVMRLGAQLAAGLEAAHREGVVHRDLKPGNLRLTTDGRLKILDFGLAQLMPHASELGMTVTLTQSEEITGTLPYMSPEQLAGAPADALTDIWSAGAVLYEMASGKRAFEQPTPALLISQILNHRPESATKKNPSVPEYLDHVILKALAHERPQRYQSAGELGAALELPSSTALPMTRRKSSSSRWIAGAIVFLILIGALAGYRLLHRNAAQTSSAPSVNRRKSVAVLGFKNLSDNPEKSWLSTALSELLTTELSQGNELRMIPGESVAVMKASLALPDADSFSQQTLTRIRQNLGSDEVIFGSYLPLGDGVLRLDVRLQDAVAGETLASVSEKGNESEIDDLVGRAGAELRTKLGIAALSDVQSALVRASLPANAEAARLYSQGLQRLRVFDAQTARDLLERAAKLDPEHAPTHSALAEAWRLLGYDSKAKDQAKQALALSAKCSREEQLLIEGRAHEILNEMPQAVESYRALWQFFPDNIDYGLSLIRVQNAAGHANEAESTLTDLRKLSASGADAARINLAEARIAAALSDFKRQQSASERAANDSRAVGASLILADALQIEADARERMGQSQEPLELSNEAHALYVSAADRGGAARVLLRMGDQLSDQGDYESAKKKFEEALPVFQEIGAKRSVRATLERIGNVYYAEGKMQEAKKCYEQSLTYDREINDLVGLASDYGNLANTLDGMGDLPGSLKMQLDSLASFNEVNDRRGSSATLNNLGNVYVEMGGLDEADKYFNQSLTMTREIAYRRGEPYPMSGQGDVLLARGNLPEAQKRYEAALALCKEMGDEDFAAQLNVGLATIALLEKRYGDGETLSRSAIGAYAKSNSAGNGAWAGAVLARNLLADGKVAEAQVAVMKAAELARQSTLLAPHFEVTLAEARVKAKSGKTSEALRSLESLLASAHKSGYGLYELQARLAIAEIETQSGAATARDHLSALEKDARQRGALLVANQAQELLGPPKSN
jgi:serine/threonine protein kinase/tetratricopeptide (TPR) repeat protein